MNKLVIVGSGAIARATLIAIAKKRSQRFSCTLIARNATAVQEISSHLWDHYNFVIETGLCDIAETRVLAEMLAPLAGAVVANMATPDTHISVMRACLEAGCHYLDTALYEAIDDFNVAPPWYREEHSLAPDFSAKGLTAVLSIGFDPGVVNVFCTKAARDDFDEISDIDIICANGGSHGHYFATNFNAAVNLKELCEETSYRENGHWRTSPAFSRTCDFVLPALGPQSLYSVGHEEVHSLARLFPDANIEFWMRIGPSFQNVLEVLDKLGMLSREPILVRDQMVAPVDVLTALLPHPNTLAERYRGKVCVGSLVRGIYAGAPRVRFYHCICDHEDCFRDTGSHVTLFTTAIPVIAAAELIMDGVWNVGRMVHPEELDPTLFLDMISRLGLPWAVIDSDLT